MKQIDQLEADLDQLLDSQRRLREQLTALLVQPKQTAKDRSLSDSVEFDHCGCRNGAALRS